jgi:thiamine biosynthesis lipoprotein
MKKIIAGLLFTFSILFLVACGGQSRTSELAVVKTPLTRTESLLHTVVQLSIYHENQEKVMDQAVDYIKEMEGLLSTTLEGSDIDRINKSAGEKAVKVDDRTFELIETALETSKNSHGRFDITIGVVNKLWNIGEENARKPEQSEIEAALPFVDYHKVKLDKKEKTVYIDKGMSLELGAISKGYIADQVEKIFEKAGITTAIINLGGNVVVMGTSPNHDNGWKVGVQDPDKTRGATVGNVFQTNRSIVTSGIYERYIEVDGKIYHHILDPRTGYPVDNNISGVTVFTDTSTQGDALSTTLFVLGIQEGMDYINKLEGVEAVFIDKEHGVHLSKGLKKSFELTNEEYHLVD